MLIPWAVIEGPGGGVGRFAEALCVALAQAGVAVELLALWQHSAPSEQRLRERLARVGVSLTTAAEWNPARPFGSLGQAIHSLRAVVRRRGYDLLHAHHEFGDVAAAALRLSGAAPRLVRTVHNEEWLWRPLVRRALTNTLYPFLFAAEAGVSLEITRRLDARPLARWRGRRAVMLHNAIDLERFQGPSVDRLTLRQELGVPPTGLVIGSVGRLSEQKDFASLLAAAPLVWQAWPTAHFVLVGEGPLELALRAQASALGLSDQIVFAGPRADVERVLPAFDVFVSSSRFEGLPTVVLESMAAGVPVVATEVSGSRELVQSGQNGLLVPPGDPAHLARAIGQVLSSAGLRQGLVAAARTTVQQFSIRRVAAGYLELYQRVAGPARPTRRVM